MKELARCGPGPLSIVLCAWLVTGCIIPLSVGSGEESGANHGATGASAMSTSDAGSASVSGSGTGGTEGTTASDDGSTETTGPMLGSVCDPQPQALTAYAVYFEGGDEEPLDVEVDALCEITGLVPIDGGEQIELSCELGQGPEARAIEVLTPEQEVTLPLSVGQSVRLRVLYFLTIDAGNERYIAISEPEGDLLLGYYRRIRIDDNAQTVAGWYAPLGLEVVEGVCGLEPYEPPMDGGSFIQMPCGYQSERQAFDVALDGAAAQRVFDRRRETVGAYDVWVLGVGRSYPQEPECPSNNPHDSAHVLMLSIP